jgi:hypothetical protein
MDPDPRQAAGAIAMDLECPYVGLRPFDEKDKRFFYGRERDAQLLRNRILSARLTLLYAPSGVGKTSLLRVCVIPALNEPARHTRPIYLDRWDAADPIGALADLIAPAPEADDGNPGASILLARIEAARRTDARTPILLLDQFERFLLGHPDKWQDFGRELGALVREGQCHVVLSLREEFLATLNAFRDQVPTLMDSTFRLEFLKGASAATAIRKPALEAGASIDDQLVARVLQELETAARKSAPDRLLARPPDAIDLPLLQLACERLWKASDGKVLDADLYQRVYAGKGLREDFEQGLVAGLSNEQTNDLALVLDKLAPRNGIKHAFTIDELLADSDLARPRLDTAVAHLEACKVLCRPQAETLELVHDAFARLLRPWIDRRLETKKLFERSEEKLRQQRNRLWAVFGLVFLVLLAAGSRFYFQARDLARTEGQLEELKAMQPEQRRQRAEPILTNVASYLWSKNKQAELVELLARPEYADLVPNDFGLDAHLREAMPEARTLYVAGLAGASCGSYEANTANATATSPNRAGGREPTTHRMSKRTGLQLSLSQSWPEENAYRLLYAWRIVASRLRERGLPAPLQLSACRDAALGAAQLRVDLTPRAPEPLRLPQTLNVPVPRESGFGVVVIAEESNPAPLGELPKILTDKMVRIEGTKEKAWLVPRWTLPIWQARGDLVFPAEYAIALVVGDFLLREPGLLIDAAFVSGFLAEARENGYCDSAGEAVRARGDEQRLRQDLIELARNGQSIAGSSYVLNTLANFPQTMSSEKVAAIVPSYRPPDRMGFAVHNSPRGAECSPLDPAAVRLPEAAMKLELRAPPDAVAAFSGPAGEPKTVLLAAIAKARSDAYARTGVVPAPVQVLVQQPEAGLGCEARLRTPWPGRVRQTALAPCSSEALASWLLQQLVDSSHRMLNAEAIRASLDSLPAGVRDWLLDNYSLTDLKLALRLVLRNDADDAKGSAETAQGPRGEFQTLRNLPWLLESLVFWNGVCNRTDAACLGQAMRETQSARIAHTRSNDSGDGSRDVIAQATQALLVARDSRQVSAAAAVFAGAVRSDMDGARRRFVERWARQAATIQLEQLLTRTTMCPQPTMVDVAKSTPPELQAIVESADFLAGGGQASAAEARRLQLCRDWGMLAAADTAEVASESLSRILAAPAEAGWTADEQYLAGFWMLDAARRGFLPPTAYDKAAQLLALAIKSWPDDGVRSKRFWEVLSVCNDSPAGRSCMRAFDRVTKSVPDSAWLPLQLGSYWAHLRGGRRADSYLALALLEQAEQNSTRLNTADQQNFKSWVSEARATANYRLVFNGEETRIDTAISLYAELLSKTQRVNIGISRPNLFRKLSDLYLFQGNFDEAGKLIDRGLGEDETSLELLQSRVFVALAIGRAGDAVAFAKSAIEPGQRNAEAMFPWVLMRLLSTPLDDETEYEARRLLASGYEYREYVRMMMYWRKGGPQNPAAMELIEDRWRTIDSRSWPARLAAGDFDVWREMFIGYFADKVKREDMLALIQDEKVFEDSAMGDLGQTRTEFLAEFHFYDALKQSVSGEPATRNERLRQSLQKSVDSKAVQTWEYHMANYLLTQLHQALAVP